MVAQYRKRRDYACDALNEMGLSITPPAGAFYLFIDISKYKMNSYDFCIRLLNEAKVCVVPGCYFGSNCDHYIRLSYACSDENLKTGLERMKQFIQTL